MANYHGLDGSGRLGRKGHEKADRGERYTETRARVKRHASVRQPCTSAHAALTPQGAGSDEGLNPLDYEQDYRGEILTFRRVGSATSCEWIGWNLTHFYETGEVECVSTPTGAFLNVQGGLTHRVDARMAAEDEADSTRS